MPSYLAGWTNRVKIAIDHSKIDAALSDFPVAIPISASCGQGSQDLSAIFDELTSDANRTKIAVTTADGQTQCYVEIEYWDDATETAILHVKVPDISASEDTILYLYYDSTASDNTTYVGDIGDAAAESVWDSDFVGVWHFTAIPGLDSTSYDNDGNPTGSPSIVDGLNGGRAIDLSGDSEYLAAGSDVELDNIALKTIESVFNADDFGEGGGGRIADKTIATNQGWGFFIETGKGLSFLHDSSGGVGSWYAGTVTADGSTWHFGAVTHDKGNINNDPVLHLDGSKPSVTEDTTPSGTWDSDADRTLRIGARGGGTRDYDGKIGELRISNIIRSDAWLKATYNTLFDTLLTYQTVDFDNRFKIAIDHSKIDADLTDFPVLINISSASGQGGADLTAIFDELVTDAERFKIAVTTSDGETQCPVEIEYWDVASETAVLHVKVPAVDNDISTVLFLHYDADVPDNTLFVGDTGDTVAQDVWDSNFISVWHLNQDPSGGADCMLDSTGNTITGTPAGTMLTEDLVDGQSDAKALDFEGTDDTVAFEADTGYEVGTGDMTISALFNQDLSHTGMVARMAYGSGESGDEQAAGIYVQSDTARLHYRDSAGNIKQIQPAIAASTWYYGSAVRDTQVVKGYINGASAGADVSGANHDHSTHVRTRVGANSDTAAANFFNGKVGEVRMSDIARSAAWEYATYDTLFDQLLSYGTTLGYLPGFKNRVKVAIDSSLIDADLTDFPVTLRLSEASGITSFDVRKVFENLQINGNRKKIAVTTADGLTQCYVEIERWDQNAKDAILHVKVPHVESSADTELYLYFDNSAADNDSFVGDTADAIAQSVWDSNFMAVYHLAQDPSGGAGAILDSTSNNNDLTSGGTMLTEDLVDSQPGKGIDFDGSNDHLTKTSCPISAYPFTMEAAGPAHVVAATQTCPVVTFADNSSSADIFMAGIHNSVARIMHSSSYSVSGTETLVEGTFCHIAGVHTGAADHDVLTNGSDKVNNTDSFAFPAGLDRITIGGVQDATPGYFAGENSEVRISDIVRADAWLKATYDTLADTLVTFSDFQSTEFKKRRKLTIDSSLIDASLVNFPLAIPLSASAGIGTEDISDIFDELKFPGSDDFIGKDGDDALNSTRWQAYTGGFAVWDIQDNKANAVIASSDADPARQSISNFVLAGDFNIQFDFTINTGPATNSWSINFKASEWDNNNHFRVRRVYDSGHKYTTRPRVAGSNGTEDTESTSDTSGKMRMTRVGNVFHGYFWTGSAWDEISTGETIAGCETNLYVLMEAEQSSSDPAIDVSFDNFTINSGTVVWPAGEPNRKKIKVTLADLITELPVEIEHFDCGNEVGILHTRVPYISPDVDTDLYLHFDRDQPDNPNVGDPGDAIAQSVWDSDFEAVWHLTEQGDGSSDEYKDSTSNANHGTADEGAGTIPTLDSDGPLGISQSFDGGDIIKCALAEPLGAKTDELVFKNTTAGVIFFDTGGSGTSQHGTKLCTFSDQSFRSSSGKATGGTWRFNMQAGGDSTSATLWFHGAMTWDGTTDANKAINYLNGAQAETATAVALETVAQTSPTVNLGGFYNGSYNPALIGGIAEVRISSIARSAAWVKATYNTLFDTLVTWGTAQEGPWLSLTWAKRRKFTISASLVDKELRDFPVALSVDASCGLGADDLTGLFTELVTANRKKMAITLADKVTECYVEVENWDSDDIRGLIHVKVPKIEVERDTEIYLYYDSAQDDNARAGDPGEAISQNVWDDNFVGVYHFTDINDPDSTSNNNDGVATGTPSIEDGLNGGKSVDLVGNNEWVYMGSPSPAYLDDIALLTVESLFNADDWGEANSGRIVDKTAATNNGWSFILNQGYGLFYFRDSSGGLGQWYVAGITADGTTWHFGAVTHDITNINNDAVLHLDGTKPSVTEHSAPSGTWDSDASAVMRVGVRDGGDREFDGKIGEVRISNIIRSDAWIKTTYETLFDILGTWSAEEANPNEAEEGDDVYAVLGAPAEVAWTVNAALVSVGALATTPEYARTVLPATAGIGVNVGTPEISWEALSTTITQNFKAIGIMSKPTVSAKGPKITATGRQPNITAAGAGPSITVTAKGD